MHLYDDQKRDDCMFGFVNGSFTCCEKEKKKKENIPAAYYLEAYSCWNLRRQRSLGTLVPQTRELVNTDQSE